MLEEYRTYWITLNPKYKNITPSVEYRKESNAEENYKAFKSKLQGFTLPKHHYNSGFVTIKSVTHILRPAIEIL
jgi:hypothetical protein